MEDIMKKLDRQGIAGLLYVGSYQNNYESMKSFGPNMELSFPTGYQGFSSWGNFLNYVWGIGCATCLPANVTVHLEWVGQAFEYVDEPVYVIFAEYVPFLV